jgi:hypothetical protein
VPSVDGRQRSGDASDGALASLSGDQDGERSSQMAAIGEACSCLGGVDMAVNSGGVAISADKLPPLSDAVTAAARGFDNASVTACNKDGPDEPDKDPRSLCGPATLVA